MAGKGPSGLVVAQMIMSSSEGSTSASSRALCAAGMASSKWTPSCAGTGPEDAANRITGSAGEYCRVFVHRLAPSDASTLRAEGAAAADALRVARAYL